ncbi:Uncharacterized protein BP5553_04725 [Venustampulla echinocandica]|uniref:Nephrocystin 3-like N-terminal domain-containing protein n=1 Tax=Venustampulla echinocandica TaxID=2656787 RepID=A0A370TP42_9HELO|nr:Uncharacterized protein BP5553_04725 [Venustampulla echinocandica]RDL37292.1 Uncharacterized protein BP5553_04725 [Venustampulla echinocandica]
MSASVAQENYLGSASKTSKIEETGRINQKADSTGKVMSTHKFTTLQDATQQSAAMFRTELGSSSEQFLSSCQSVETFFDVIAGIRLHQMPHHSSRWDKVLKWAEFFATQVQIYSEMVSQFADHANQAARMIWASSLSLIKLGPKHISMLEKSFGVFYSCGLTLGFFLRHHEPLRSSEKLQLITAASFADLLKLVTGVTIDYTQKQLYTRFSARGFDERFSQTIASFFSHGDRFTDTIWATRLQSLAKPGDISVDLVRDFLMPHDTVTRRLAVTRFIRRPRADYTCEWFSRHLTDFTQGDKATLLVTGKPASGKTVLSEWVVERLQSFHGRRASEVMMYTIDPDLKTENTSLNVVKGLLLQMLQLSVGDNALYKSLSLAYKLSVTGSSTSQVESALWKALEGGLRSDRNQAIIVDGIDDLSGGETASLKLLQQLNSVVSKHSMTKCVVFSRPFSSSISKSYGLFSIEPEHTSQDMHYVAEYSLPTTPNFEALVKEDRTSLISTLVKGAAGSFGWLLQALEILKAEKTPESTLKTARTLPKTLPKLIDLTLGTLDFKHRETKSILAWLLAAERPLLVEEVRQLMELDTSTCTHTPRSTRTEDEVVNALGPFIDIRDGFVRFRHNTIKQNLLDRAKAVTDYKNTGPFPFSIEEAHYDLTIRSMAYVKINLTRDMQPTLEPLSHYKLDELFNSYELLQYSARYWSSHFAASPMHKPTTKHKIPANFKTCFPHSTLLAMIEGSCYQFQFPITDALNHCLHTLSVRRSILAESSEPVLQTLLNLARTSQVTLKPTEINGYYYDAWKLAITLKLTTVAMTCAHTYTEMASSITATKNTEITTCRIEMLQYIITIQRETGVHERETVGYLEQLATIYSETGETDKATAYYKEIYELNVRIYGRNAPETRRSYQNLTSTVQKSNRTDEIYNITKKDYDEALYTLPSTDPKRISLTWAMIELYEKRKDTRRLEETLVTLWQSLTRATTRDTKVQESKIDVAISYVELLKHQKRTREAENILRTLWIDLEQEDESTTTITRLKVIGDQLLSVGAVDTARSVYARLWAYYVKMGMQSSAEATSVSNALNQVTRETTTETSYEVMTRVEIFETTLATGNTETINTTTVKNAVTLVDIYYQQENWKEVIRVGTITLGKLWPAFNTKEIKAPLPSTYYSETIEIINCLSFSHVKLHQIEAAESIYLRAFYAVIATLNSPDELLDSSSTTLIDFYHTHGMLEKTIVIYRDLSEEIQRRHGKTNPLAISTLYTLGDMSMQLNDTKDAEFAYREIYTNLTEGSGLIHRDAIKACLALCTIYEQLRQYSSAHKVYSSIWHTFIKHGKDYELQPAFAENLYQKYVRILKQDAKMDYATLHQLAVDYRKACVRFYGTSSEITLKATLQLAGIKEESDQHREEAINLYEEADQRSRELPEGEISEPTMAAIVAGRKRIPHLYSISKLSTSPRALTVYSQKLQSEQSRDGYAHRGALKWLSLLSIAQARQGSKESSLNAIHTLESSIFYILRNEKSSQRLADSGSKIAEIYLKAGLKPDAEQLLGQLRSQAVFGVSNVNQNLGLAEGERMDPSTWVFIVTFGVTLAGRKEPVSSAMADLISELYIYEEYNRSIAQKAPFLATLSSGSRLLQFTRSVNDVSGTARVETDLLRYFSAGLNAPKTINNAILAEFLQLVLVEIHRQEPDVSILKISSEAVSAYLDKGRFQEAHDLSFLLDRFQQFQGGYNSLEKIDLGLQVALALAGRGKVKCQDTKIRTMMLELSQSITNQIMKTVRSSQINISDVPIDLLNNVCGLLGDYQNMDDLEWILTALWQSRDSQPTWSTSTVVGIGRRLVETQFSHGHQDQAIALCEDICYNLRRVWGALDATTLEMHILLSSFHTAAGNYRKAMLVHEEVLRDTVSDKGSELPLAEASKIAVQHLELLKRAYQRLGGWDKEPQMYVDLYHQIAHVFGSEDAWRKSAPAPLEKWQAKGADSLGIWTRPQSFEFIRTSTRKHSNHLRRSSRPWNFRPSHAYSSQSVAIASGGG